MPNQEPAFAGLCIKLCSNDNIANTFQSLKLKSKGIDLLDNQSLTIRTVSEVIDLMVASFPGVHCTGPFISNTVTHGNPQVTIYSDASLTCWGGVVNSTSTRRQWSEDESKNHPHLTLKAFCSDFQNCHVKAMIDNKTAISYMNSMGGRSLSCSQITWELWVW